MFTVTPQPLHDALSGKLIDETGISEKASLSITTEDSQEKNTPVKLQKENAETPTLVTDAGIVRVPVIDLQK